MNQIRVCIKGAGEMASAVAWRLFMVNIRNIIMLEVPQPLAVRRRVSFCEAVYDGHQTVEGVRAVRVDSMDSIRGAWERGNIAVAVDPEWNFQRRVCPDVVVDAVLAKKNLGTGISDAPLVIALGPGFWAGRGRIDLESWPFCHGKVLGTSPGLRLSEITAMREQVDRIVNNENEQLQTGFAQVIYLYNLRGMEGAVVQNHSAESRRLYNADSASCHTRSVGFARGRYCGSYGGAGTVGG